MALINTVLGPLDTGKMGFTLSHEHIMLAPFGIYHEYPGLLGDNLIDIISSELAKAKKSGIDTIIDATPFDLGRDAGLMAEASRRSRINIIACTGKFLFVLRPWLYLSPDELAELFINDIEKGIAGTGIKAGILKAASDAGGVTPEQEASLRGIARAHLKTGVPIMLHSYAPGQVGRQQLAILKEEGVNLQRVKVDHSNDTADVEYLTWLLEQGCYLGMDRYPGHKLSVSPSVRNQTLKTLIDKGFANRLLLSQDWFLTHVKFREDHIRENPDGFLYLKKVIIPQLKETGVSDPVINQLFVENPRRYFEGV